MKKISGQLVQEEVLSKEAIKRGFRIEDGLVVKYTLDEDGGLIRKRKNWKSNIRSYSRQFIKDFCEECKSKEELTIHHIKSISKGGKKGMSNCKTLCQKCHTLIHYTAKRKKVKKVHKVKKAKKVIVSGEKLLLILEKGLWGEYRIIGRL